MVTVSNQKRFFFFAIRVSPQSVLNQIGILPLLPLRAVEKSLLPGVFSILAHQATPGMIVTLVSRPAHRTGTLNRLQTWFPLLVLIGVVWCSLVLFGPKIYFCSLT